MAHTTRQPPERRDDESSLCGARRVAAVTLTSVASANPYAAKQRVAITAKGLRTHRRSASSFSSPRCRPDPESRLGYGNLLRLKQARRDASGAARRDRELDHHLQGQARQLVIRVRLEQVDAGNGYREGTGTWKVVRGTGRYTQITGGGRVGNAWVDSGPWRSAAKASSPFRSAMAQDRAARSLVRRYVSLTHGRFERWSSYPESRSHGLRDAGPWMKPAVGFSRVQEKQTTF